MAKSPAKKAVKKVKKAAKKEVKQVKKVAKKEAKVVKKQVKQAKRVVAKATAEHPVSKNNIVLSKEYPGLLFWLGVALFFAFIWMIAVSVF